MSRQFKEGREMSYSEAFPPVYHPFADLYREQLYERLSELDATLAELTVELRWPDEELTEEQEEEMEIQIQILQDDIREIEGILGL
jgi:tRNA A37 threonylcarbamoyladenosine biosynthesis protein TsaE